MTSSAAGDVHGAERQARRPLGLHDLARGGEKGPAEIAVVVRSRVGDGGSGLRHRTTIACIAPRRYATERRKDLASAAGRRLYR